MSYIVVDMGPPGVDPIIYWAEGLILEVENYLGKWAAFERFCER